MIAFLRRLFHRHQWVYYGDWEQRYCKLTNVRYSVRYYKCSVCGRLICVDGRTGYGRYENSGNRRA